MPKFSWRRTGDTLAVSWEDPPSKVSLWQAHREDRDFRGAKWTETSLSEGTGCIAKVDPPEEGWTAFFVAFQYPSGTGHPYTLTTEIVVTPDTLPYSDL